MHLEVTINVEQIINTHNYVCRLLLVSELFNTCISHFYYVYNFLNNKL